MYTFLFDRRSLTLFLSGLAGAGAVVFVGGVLTGMRINLPAPSVRAAQFAPLSSWEGGLLKSAEASSFKPPSSSAAALAAALSGEPAPEKTPATDSASEEPDSAAPVAEKAVRPTVRRPPPEPAPAPETQAQAPSSSGYFVQVGAFRITSNARGRAAALAAEGFRPEVVKVRTPTGGTLNAVRLGNFATREDAVAEANLYVERAPGREAFVRKTG